MVEVNQSGLPIIPEILFPDYTGVGWDKPCQTEICEDSAGAKIYKHELPSGLQYPVVVDTNGKVANRSFDLEVDLGNGWRLERDSWFLSGESDERGRTLQALVEKKVEGSGVVHECNYLIDPVRRNLVINRVAEDENTRFVVSAQTAYPDGRENTADDRKLKLMITSRNLLTGHQTQIDFDQEGEVVSINLARLPVEPLMLDLTEDLQQKPVKDVARETGEEIASLNLFGQNVDLGNRAQVNQIFMDVMGISLDGGSLSVDAVETMKALIADINSEPGEVRDPRALVKFTGGVGRDLRFMA